MIRISTFLLLLFSVIRCAAEVPTITVPTANGQATTLTSPTFYGCTNAVFSYYGVPVMGFTNQNEPAGLFGYVALHGSPTTIPYYNGGRPVCVRFSINAQAFEFYCAPAGQEGIYQVDDGIDQTIPPIRAFTVNTNGAHPFSALVRVAYSTKAQRNIELWLSGAYTNGCTFYGVNVGSGDTIGASVVVKRTLGFIGDSLTESYTGAGTNETKWSGGVPMLLGHLGTNVQTIPCGEGGTGYVAGDNGDSTPGFTNLLARLPDFIAQNNDFNVVFMGYNDQATAAGTNMASTNLFWVSMTNALMTISSSVLSNKTLIVSDYTKDIGGAIPATWKNMDWMITNECAALGLPWVSPIHDAWLNAGNSTGYVSSDTVHPTYVGYYNQATNINVAMQVHFPSWTNLAPAAPSPFWVMPFIQR